MKNEDLIGSALYGTWYFVTESTTDLGYYDGQAYMVMHFMPDPMQPIHSCDDNDDDDYDDDINNNSTTNCNEEQNNVCNYDPQTGKKECINTEKSTVEWSDVVAYFQFGIHFRYGIAFREHYNVDTDGWVGPYNIIMARTKRHHVVDDNDDVGTPDIESSTKDDVGDHDDEGDGNNNIVRTTTVRDTFLSRYVQTPTTAGTLQRPQNCSIVPYGLFDTMVGVSSIRKTIHQQRRVSMTRGDDPYSAYQSNCDHGDVQPILPLLEVSVETRTTVRTTDQVTINKTVAMSGLRVEYNILNLPDPIADKGLYRIWPTMQRHLETDFPMGGPYCFGKDPHRGHSIRLSYDSTNVTRNHTWHVVKDTCIDGVPCWNGNGNGGHGGTDNNNRYIPYDNRTSGIHVIDPTGLAMVLCYAMGLVLIISLVFNMQLSNQLKRLQQSSYQHNDSETSLSQQQQPSPVGPPPDAFGPVGGPQVVDDGNLGNDLEEPLLPRGGPMHGGG